MTVLAQLKAVQKASRNLVQLKPEHVNTVLLDLASAVETATELILQANELDLARMDVKNPKYDRLALNASRILGIVSEIKQVASLNNPLGLLLDHKTVSNGLRIEKVSVPLGVVGVIYEARPNVTLDVFSLCFKSGNACVLKGGSDAQFSNECLVNIIQSVLEKNNIDQDILQLLPPDRSATDELLQAVGYVDVLIPRGSQSLIDSVRKNARVPVIETGAGIVHVYFDEAGDLQKGKGIVVNSKTRRVSVCNALDCLIVHKARLSDLSELVAGLSFHQVILFADEPAYQALKGHYPEALLQAIQADSFGTEFLDYKMSIKTVSDFEEALEHIAQYSSKHSEAIVTDDLTLSEAFLQRVDAAAVYANVSTAFTDGAQFGLGAEIGISTQKLHARGPMGLKELTSYKWMVRGQGQIRA